MSVVAAHEEVLEFIRNNPRAVFATRRKDGSPQLSPVLAAVDAESRIIISTRETAMKTRNLLRDPRASICVITERFFGEWHSADGTVDIVGLPEAMEPLVDYYRRAVGEHTDWDDYRRAMERDRRVLLRMSIERSGPTVQG